MEQSVQELELEEGWAKLEMGITKLIDIFEGHQIDMESKLMMHDMEYKLMMQATIYSMCTDQKHGHEYYSKELYERYQGVYDHYLQSKVLPAIQEKHGVLLIQELVKRWENHKVMVTALCQYFGYLDRCYIRQTGLPTLKDAGFCCFRKIVSEETTVDAVVSFFKQQRLGGEEIDQNLLENVLKIFEDLGNKEALLRLTLASNAPGYSPSSPGYIPTSPCLTMTSAAYDPNSPGYSPTLPAYIPTLPHFNG